MPLITRAALILAALIHLLPTVGALGGPRLTALYGLPITDPNLEILLRHRAVLFGVVGGLLLAGAFHPPLQAAGLAVGLTSVISFLAIAKAVGGYNRALARVVKADLIALPCLLAGALSHALTPS
jgi:hypothetical protein